MKKIGIFIILFGIFLYSSIALAHPGRTDSLGCHTCRTNCPSWGLSYGEYHCHRAKSYVPQPKEPIRSHRVEGEAGYTEPAPDYKIPISKTKSIISPYTKNSDNKKLKENSDDKSEDVLLWALLIGGVGYLVYKIKKG